MLRDLCVAIPSLTMTFEMKICPFCERGELERSSYSKTLAVGDDEFRVDGLEAFSCTSCGELSIFDDQARRNRAKIADSKRAIQGLLTGQEIVAVRQRLELSQQDASSIFGGGPNAFSKYERGSVTQSVAMDRLLRVADAIPEAASFLREWSKPGGAPTQSAYGDFAMTFGQPLRRSTDIAYVRHVEWITNDPINDAAYLREKARDG